MRRKLKAIIGIAGLIGLCAAFNAQAQSSTNFAIKGSAFVSAGGKSSSSCFAVRSAMGQNGILGKSTSASFAVGGGLLRAIQLNAPGANLPPLGNPTQNTLLRVRSKIPDPQGLPVSATLYYRLGGRSAFNALPMTKSPPTSDTFSVAVPADSVTMRGLEIYLTASNGFESKSDPPAGANDPLDLQVSVTANAPATPDQVYQLVSFPFELRPNGRVSTQLSELSPSNNTLSRGGWWNPIDTAYDEFPADSPFVPGRSMFLITRGPKVYNGTGLSNLADTTIKKLLPGLCGDSIGIDYVSLTIDSGWNMIASPFPYTVNIESVDVVVAGDPTVYEQGDAERTSRIGTKALRRLVPSVSSSGVSYGYLPDSLLKPWQGFFLKNLKKERVTLLFPRQDDGFPSTVAEPPKDYGLTLDWKVAITAKSENQSTFPAILGTAKKAKNDIDQMDIEVPPALPGQMRIVFRHGKEFGAAGDYMTDIRTPLTESESWSFSVQPGSNRVFELNFDGLTEVPADYDVLLTDVEGRTRQNLRIEPVYRFIASVERHFALTVTPKAPGGVALMPTSYELYQNLPNPFNPQTLIKYDLPQEADVRLDIFNILGQKVATLVNGYESAGPKSVVWNGADAGGAKVASGVYFYKLSAGRFSAVKRMMFLK